MVLGHYFSSDRAGDRVGTLPAPLAGLAPPPPGLLHWDGYATSIAPLAGAAPAGFINAVTEPDGRGARAVPLVAAFDGQLYPSFALAVLRAGLGQPPLALQRRHGQPDGPVSAVRLGGTEGLRIPLDARGTALVPYRGAGGAHGGSFRYISALDVIDGRLPAASLHGATPCSASARPACPICAPPRWATPFRGSRCTRLISGALDGRVPARPDHVDALQLLWMVALGVGLLMGLTLMSVPGALLLGLALAGVSVCRFNPAAFLGAGLGAAAGARAGLDPRRADRQHHAGLPVREPRAPQAGGAVRHLRAARAGAPDDAPAPALRHERPR